MLLQCCLAMPSGAVPNPPDPATQNLLLSVTVNGHPIDKIGEFRLANGELFVKRLEWQDLGFRLNRARQADDADAELKLCGNACQSYQLDMRAQTIAITAPSSSLQIDHLNASNIRAASNLPIETGIGALMNYDAVATHIHGNTLAEALLDLRGFSTWGTIDSSFVATAGAAGSTRPLVRLDTTYTYSDPETLRQYRAGDIISGGLAWTRPVRLGGVQISTDFAIRPDLITFPIPSLAGEVAVPSSLDVLIDGVQRWSHDIPPGPFEIAQLPVVTGANAVSLVVRDAVGRDTVQTLPIYVSSLLLARGLSSLSAEFGAVRLRYGTFSDDYQALAGSGSYRRGILDWLTLEAHAEATTAGDIPGEFESAAGAMAGAGVAFTVGHLGAISLDAAASHFGARTGKLLSASVEHISQTLSLSGSAQMAGPGFNDIASAFGDPVPRLELRGNASLALGDFGTVQLNYAGIWRRAVIAPPALAHATPSTPDQGDGLILTPLLPASRVSLLSASYTRPIFKNRISLFATAFHDFADHAGSGALLGLSFALGPRTAVGATVNSAGHTEPSASLSASRSADTIGDLGGQLRIDTGPDARELAEADYKSPYALVGIAADQGAGETALRATAQGTIAFADKTLFAANTIRDSFAVVDTAHTAGVEILQENRPVGITGPSGLLLVPELRSYDANRLGIDPKTVPLDAEIGTTERLVRPGDRSGIVVKFPVRFSNAALLTLTDTAGRPIPIGSTARLLGTPNAQAAAIGYDGDTYLTGLSAENTVLVSEVGGQHCAAQFAYHRESGILPTIGPLACH